MKIPPFYALAATQYKTTDFGTEDGCKALCRMIMAAWRRAGHPDVTAKPKSARMKGPKGGEMVRYAVETNLIRGLPK